MFIPSWFGFIRHSTRRTSSGRKPDWQRTAHRRGLRLSLEQLEDRTLLSNYTAATVSDLIADINAANQTGGSNTITLVAPATSPCVLAAVNNTSDGATGLPVIEANDNLSIVGNGDTIERSGSTGTPAFRLFDVALGAALTLQNLTLQGGLAFGSGVSADGGAIYNQGNLTLNDVTVQNNVAKGGDGAAGRWNSPGQPGQSAAGGGIYSNGTLTLEGNTKVQSNLASGGAGGQGAQRNGNQSTWLGGSGGNGFGGGVYVAGGTVEVTGSTLSSNTVQGGKGGTGGWGYLPPPPVSTGGPFPPRGGPGGNGGNGFGGGLDMAAGTVTLSGTTLSSNSAQGGRGGNGGTPGFWNPGFGGKGGNGGNGLGGGAYVAAGTVTLTSIVLSSNTAQGGQGGNGGYGAGSGGNGGNGFGGGLNAGGGTITLHNDTVTGNSALSGGAGSGYRSGSPGLGEGGGLYIDPLANICLDAFTLANIINNTASTQDPNIHGSYTICP